MPGPAMGGRAPCDPCVAAFLSVSAHEVDRGYASGGWPGSLIWFIERLEAMRPRVDRGK